MTTLSKSQRTFLASHEIPLSRVFDATGLARNDYQSAMREINALIAVGVSPCQAAGHTMRTRAGHCVQCKPNALGFLLRHLAVGEVYVANSESAGLVKVGSAKSAAARIPELNRRGYAGTKDWRLYTQLTCIHSGAAECEAQRLLQASFVQTKYVWAGRETQCYEIFDCSPNEAVQAVQTAVVTVSLRAVRRL